MKEYELCCLCFGITCLAFSLYVKNARKMLRNMRAVKKMQSSGQVLVEVTEYPVPFTSMKIVAITLLMVGIFLIGMIFF